MNTPSRLVVLSKREYFGDLYHKTQDVRILVDTRVDGVKVPDAHLRKTEVCLQFNKASSEFESFASSLQATLEFSGKTSLIDIPWRAIYGILDKRGNGLIWAEDTPEDVFKKLTAHSIMGSQVSDPFGKTEFGVIDGGYKATPATS